MNLLGKIFVFAVFVMSLVLMTFAGVVSMSHTNWKAEADRRQQQLAEAQEDRQRLTDTITTLTQKVAESEQARDEVIAKLQSAIVQKEGLLRQLQEEKAKWEGETRAKLVDLEKLGRELKEAGAMVDQLQKQVREQQVKVDSQVDRSAQLSASLAETEARLAIAEERKSQLEKQVANARLLLQQSGLSPDSATRDRVPTIEGDVVAVAAGSIEVSLGSDDGLQVGHALEVYREGQYVGRAIVRSVTPDRAVAEIVKAYARGVVQRGDKVTTRLKA